MSMLNRYPYRILLFSLPFPSFALFTVAGSGIRLSQIMLAITTITITVHTVKNSGIKLNKDVLVFSLGMCLIILIGFVQVSILNRVPYVNPPAYPSVPGQMLFWISAVAFLIVSNLYTLQARNLRVIRSDWLWFVAGAGAMLFIGFYEYVSPLLNIPFPYQVVYSNPTFNHNWGSTIAGFNRFTSTFPEPSMFGLYGTIALGVFLGMRNRLFVTIILGALILSFSTSSFIGILTLFFAFIIFEKYYGRSVVCNIYIITAFFVIASLLLFSGFIEPLWETTVGKVNSYSFQRRSTMLYNGLLAWTRQPLFGWGIGSVRTFDGLTLLLLNFGIIGSLWIFLFFSRTLKISSKVKLARGFRIALAGGIIVHTISNPDWTFPFIWVIIGTIWGIRNK
jgi:hypothetical protein